MNRRSFVRWLGLAPVAAPAALAASAQPATLTGRVKAGEYAAGFSLSLCHGREGVSTFTFDGRTLSVPSRHLRG